MEKELSKIDKKLNILLQVSTGDEDTKMGVEPKEVIELVSLIRLNCPRLRFMGLMSMGKLGDREGFKEMKRLKDELLGGDCGIGEEEFVLSMGTSLDYEMAIEEGATEVRLGTTIFGSREGKK